MAEKRKVKELVNMTKKYLQQEKERGVKYIREPDMPEKRKKAVIMEPIKTKNESLSLEELKKTVLACKKCGLSETRVKVVFGQGNPGARLMFIGEGPGYDEDRQGLAFIGKAGQLLTKIINAMKLDREEVFIANIVKCHPLKDPSRPEARGNDRPPTTEEVQACLPYLKNQIESIKPEIIVTLGAPSARTILEMTGDADYDKKAPISSYRGRFFNYGGIKVMPTFHPAYLLRDPHKKKDVWEDMQKVMKELGV